MKLVPSALIALFCSLQGACDFYFPTGEEGPASEEAPDAAMPSEDADATTSPDDAIPTVALNACDDQGFLNAEWLTSDSQHFRFHYLPGSAAEADIIDIIDTREEAYSEIATTLGITAQPVLQVYLSPSRHAAEAHGLGFGRAYPGYDSYEVIYTGASNSFESSQYGHLIAANLAYYTDPANAEHLYVLSVGINETLDSAHRDMHQAYAMRLNAHEESLTYRADLSEGDVWGNNRGRAGSLVRTLVDRYGWPTFVDIYRRTSIGWSQGCYRHEAGPCIDSAASATSLLSEAIQSVTGDSWSAVRANWLAAVDQALLQAPQELSEGDRSEILGLFAVMDHAVATNNALEYRTAMDGFYCDWADEDERVEIARRVVESAGPASSRVVTVHPIGINNFDEVVALVERTDALGAASQQRLWLELFPEGWRVTWSEEWR